MSDDPFADIPDPRPTRSPADAVRAEAMGRVADGSLWKAGGFEAARNDPNHPIHEIFDDLEAVERDYETVVAIAEEQLNPTHYTHSQGWGASGDRVELTLEGSALVESAVKQVLHTQASTHYFEDPGFDFDNPDDLGQVAETVYFPTHGHRLRYEVLCAIAPDIAAAGGFPGLRRHPSHRRNRSPVLLERKRQQYDAIVERAEARLNDDDFCQSLDSPSNLGDDFGWALTGPASSELEKIVGEVERLSPDELAGDRAHSRWKSTELRRVLGRRQLGLRDDKYLDAIIKSATSGSALQDSARAELTRREGLSEKERLAESAIRAREAARCTDRVEQRSFDSSGLSI